MKPENQIKTDIPFSIVFVCHHGELELKSLLLGISLYTILDKAIKIIVAIPENIRPPSPKLLKLFEHYQFDIHYFKNEYIFNSSKNSDLISNKIFAIKSVNILGEDLLFLDSDIINLSDFSSFSSDYDITGINAYKSHFYSWEKLVERFNISNLIFNSNTLIDNKKSPPYFNAGFLYVKNNIKNSFCDEWLKNYLILKNEKGLLNDFGHFADQIAITITILKQDLTYRFLDKNFNFPLKFIPFTDGAINIHYHNPKILLSCPEMKKLIVELVQKCPLIEDFFKKYPLWGYYYASGLKKNLYLLEHYLLKWTR